MRIVQVLQDESHWGEIGPATLEKGLGGRETAMVQLAMKWAELGHEVITCCPRDSVDAYEFPSGGVARFVPYQLFESVVPAVGANALVMWECPWAINMPGIREMVDFACVEMQVAHLSVAGEQFESMNKQIDAWCVLSPWAGRFLELQEESVGPKLKVHPNGIDLGRWAGLEQADQGDETPKFFYSSSPDRGLAGLLRAWPEIRRRIPNAELYVAYGAEGWLKGALWSHSKVAEDALAVANGLQQPGVKYLGKIGQDQLAEVQAGCHALLYPCNAIQPTETGCITAVEAGASGSVMILSDEDCLGEEFGDCSKQIKVPFTTKDIADAVVEVWEDRALRESLIAKGSILAEERTWDRIAKGWIEMFQDGKEGIEIGKA